jgi:hypothetical protein
MMAGQQSDKDPGGQQPEFLKGLDAAAQAGGVKPADQTLQATGRTAPKPDSLEREEAKAAGILHDNAMKDTGRKP